MSECCVQQAYHQRRLFFFFCGHYAAVDCDHHCSRTLQCLLLSVAIVRCCIATSIVAPNQQRILEVFLSSGWLDGSLSAAHPSKSSPSPPKYFPFASASIPQKLLPLGGFLLGFSLQCTAGSCLNESNIDADFLRQ